MDIARAFTYTFEDRNWVETLALSAIIGFVSVILTPFLVGLIGWAALLGYQVALVNRLRRGVNDLPRWDDFAEKIRQGSSVLTALLVYNLPNLLPACCFAATFTSWRDGFFGSAIGLGVVCCLIPLLLIYNLLTWPMLALGIARYAEEGNIGVFFQFGDLFNTTFQRDAGLTAQYLIFALAANIALGLVAAIPCLGWAVAPALSIQVHAALTAQFGALADQYGGPPPKRKR